MKHGMLHSSHRIEKATTSCALPDAKLDDFTTAASNEKADDDPGNAEG